MPNQPQRVQSILTVLYSNKCYYTTITQCVCVCVYVCVRVYACTCCGELSAEWPVPPRRLLLGLGFMLLRSDIQPDRRRHRHHVVPSRGSTPSHVLLYVC